MNRYGEKPDEPIFYTMKLSLMLDTQSVGSDRRRIESHVQFEPGNMEAALIGREILHIPGPSRYDSALSHPNRNAREARTGLIQMVALQLSRVIVKQLDETDGWPT